MQRISELKRLSVHFTARFAAVRDWEKEQRAIGDARANYSIAKSQKGGSSSTLTLEEIEKSFVDSVTNEQTDMFGCFCSY